MSEYPRYLRAAKLKSADPASIFESAATDSELTAGQLGQLASILRERHGYRLPKSMRDPLIDRLLEADVGPQRIAVLLGCHPRTVARRQTVEGDKTRPPYLCPILSCVAAGGGSDTRQIARLLRGDGSS